MTNTPNASDDPAVTGVPPETPDSVRPSATGVVAGPLDGDTDIDVADVRVGSADDGGSSIDQILEDAEGGIEGSTLDDPDN